MVKCHRRGCGSKRGKIDRIAFESIAFQVLASIMTVMEFCCLPPCMSFGYNILPMDNLRNGSVLGCFLCSPDPDLIYRKGPSGVALSGLGPIVSGYSVVATCEHIASAADAAAGQAPGFTAFACEVRVRLASLYGGCLLTEHGRVPVCVDVSGTTDPHCHHAHFLVFPQAPDLQARVREHFLRADYAATLEEALWIAATHEEYFLFSQEPTHYLVLTRPGRIIRQFARLIVEEALGHPEFANWRHHPHYDEAACTARQLRSVFQGERSV